MHRCRKYDNGKEEESLILTCTMDRLKYNLVYIRV